MKASLDQLEQRLLEAYDELWDSFVDPREPYLGDGQRWLTLGGGLTHATCDAIADESQLADIRRQCRQLALENEFAINGHENRISYIVGSGHTYRATARKVSPGAHAGGNAASARRLSNVEPASARRLSGVEPESARRLSDVEPASARRLSDVLAAVQHELDAFLVANHWHQRQQEIVRRRDRDGEAFLRFFTAADGTLRIRFVEPDQVFTPPDQAGNPAARLGVLTDLADVESIMGYFVDGRLVDAAEIQHRKANVDANVRRGLPLFYPVRKNLRRAEKLLRNMSVVAEIQSAIALIRKHRQGTLSGVQQFVANQADATLNAPLPDGRGSPRVTTFRRYGPGTILDAPAGLDYDFPAAGVDAKNFVAVLQAELRAIASRLVMPEFMLTSDASNANYSSTMVAEGPAMRFFERMQREQVCDDLGVMWRVVEAAVAAGRLPRETKSVVEIQAAPPSLMVRDQLQEAQRRRIENTAGILSPQTWSQLSGLDYDQEQANFAAHEVTQPLAAAPMRREAVVGDGAK